MQNKQIVFTAVNTAKLLSKDLPVCNADQVVVETAVSTLSSGTERANITGDPNVSGGGPSSVTFPRALGYSSAGTVVSVGSGVTDVAVGDRVVVFWGTHSRYNIVSERNVVKIPYDNISFEEAALAFIASFSMAAIRKTRLEMGESAVVMGLGLLGQFAVALLRAAGAMPIVAVDPIIVRREEALTNGADFVFDPFDVDFVDKVKAVTDGGARIAVEVTGRGEGLEGTLDVMARFGRVALLGCTRDKNFTIDYYKKVHFPGITLVGAHTLARPESESAPGWFTHTDDIRSVLRLCHGNRLDLLSTVKETHAPEDCEMVYHRLIHEKNFPTVVQFDWRRLRETD